MSAGCGFGPKMTRDNHPCSCTTSLQAARCCSSNRCTRARLSGGGGMESALRTTPLLTIMRSECTVTTRRLESTSLVAGRLIGVGIVILLIRTDTPSQEFERTSPDAEHHPIHQGLSIRFWHRRWHSTPQYSWYPRPHDGRSHRWSSTAFRC
jgi:hypothetical protein